MSAINKNKLVTVYITTYNRLGLLKRAVDSVLNQTYPNIEIIVSDDGSTDSTHDYLIDMQHKGILTAILNKGKPKGACYCRNQAIKIAKGEFITGLDDDDYFEKWRISTFVNKWCFLSKSDDSQSQLAGLFDDVIVKSKNMVVRTSQKAQVDYIHLRASNAIGNQVFTKTEFLKSIGGFDVNMLALQDWETWYRLSKKFGYFINVNSFSYVVDRAHGEIRISEKKAAKIKQAFDLLESKLSPFTIKEKVKFTETLTTYHQVGLKPINYFYLILGFKFRLLFQIMKRKL